MKNKVKMLGIIVFVAMISLSITACDTDNCPGNSECTVTIIQTAQGLAIDRDAMQSTCGSRATWNSDSQSWSGGCNVQNQIDNRNRTYGTHTCNC